MNSNVDEAFLMCLSCPVVEILPLHISTKHLLEIRQFSIEVKNRSAVPIVALISHYSSTNFPKMLTRQCRYLYKQRWPTQKEKVGCFARHILIENIATKLDYSVEYLRSDMNINNLLVDISFPGAKHYSTYAVLGQKNWIKLYATVSNDNLLKQVLRGAITCKLLYCTKTIEREGFSFLFRTSPFDDWSWLLIGFSVLTVIIMFHGPWFPVFVILMRQECTILQGKQKLLMIFILITIVLTYGYEGVISSFLTAQPPLIVYNTLKELLSNGYQMYAPHGGDLTPYRRILEKENITRSLESKLFMSNWKRNTNTYVVSKLAQCNLTFVVQTELQNTWKVEINRAYDKINCKYVKETRHSFNIVFQYFGEHYLKFVKYEEIMIQSGIWAYYINYEEFIKELPNMRRIELMDYKDGLPIQFAMTDWKILSIFIAWIGLLVMGFVEFIGECLNARLSCLNIHFISRRHELLNFRNVTFWIWCKS